MNSYEAWKESRENACGECGAPIWYNTFLLEWFHYNYLDDDESHLPAPAEGKPRRRARVPRPPADRHRDGRIIETVKPKEGLL